MKKIIVFLMCLTLFIPSSGVKAKEAKEEKEGKNLGYTCQITSLSVPCNELFNQSYGGTYNFDEKVILDITNTNHTKANFIKFYISSGAGTFTLKNKDTGEILINNEEFGGNFTEFDFITNEIVDHYELEINPYSIVRISEIDIKEKYNEYSEFKDNVQNIESNFPITGNTSEMVDNNDQTYVNLEANNVESNEIIIELNENKIYNKFSLTMGKNTIDKIKTINIEASDDGVTYQPLDILNFSYEYNDMYSQGQMKSITETQFKYFKLIIPTGNYTISEMHFFSQNHKFGQPIITNIEVSTGEDTKANLTDGDPNTVWTAEKDRVSFLDITLSNSQPVDIVLKNVNNFSAIGVENQFVSEGKDIIIKDVTDTIKIALDSSGIDPLLPATVGEVYIREVGNIEPIVQGTLLQKGDAVKEQEKLNLALTRSPYQYSGIYLTEGEDITIYADIPENSNVTYDIIGYNSADKTSTVLINGNNYITPKNSGILYFENPYLDGEQDYAPNITVIGGKLAPTYKLEKTDIEYFNWQLNNRNGEMGNLVSNDVMVSTSKDAMNEFLTDPKLVLEDVYNIQQIQYKLAGLDNSTEIDMKPTTSRTFIRESRGGSGYMYANDKEIGLSSYGTTQQVLNDNLIVDDGWGIAHEMGHQMQQKGFSEGFWQEVTNNIYSLVTDRDYIIPGFRFKEGNSNFDTGYAWAQNLDPNKDYISELSVWGKLVLFEQLDLAFGDEFYHEFFKQYRRLDIIPSTDQERLDTMMYYSCKISGYNLLEFFEYWGIYPTQEALDKINTLSLLDLPENVWEYNTTNYTEIPMNPQTEVE